MMGGSFKIVPAVGLHFKKKRHRSVFVYKEKKISKKIHPEFISGCQ